MNYSRRRVSYSWTNTANGLEGFGLSLKSPSEDNTYKLMTSDDVKQKCITYDKLRTTLKPTQYIQFTELPKAKKIGGWGKKDFTNKKYRNNKSYKVYTSVYVHTLYTMYVYVYVVYVYIYSHKYILYMYRPVGSKMQNKSETTMARKS